MILKNKWNLLNHRHIERIKEREMLYKEKREKENLIMAG